MKIEPFALERWMTAHELSASYTTSRRAALLPSLLTTCSPSKSSKNVNPKIVSEMLGHATISQTIDTYSHVMPGMGDIAATALEDALSSNYCDKQAGALCCAVLKCSLWKTLPKNEAVLASSRMKRTFGFCGVFLKCRKTSSGSFLPLIWPVRCSMQPFIIASPKT